jgi:histone demethylase JARID1
MLFLPVDTRANLAYLDGLGKFHKQQGTNLHRLPYVDKKPLDLYKLKKCVETRGGFEKVCKHKKWAEIGRDLGYSGKIMSSLSTSLKNSYQKWLEPYEEYLKLAKPGVHQQLEYEYGGPLATPGPAATPMKKSGAFSPSAAAKSPARQTTDALLATPDGRRKDADRDGSLPDATPTPAPSRSAVTTPVPTSGFRAINSGGFTAVNAPFTAVNGAAKVETPLPKSLSTATTTPTKEVSDIKHPASVATPLKRQLSCDSSNLGSNDGEGDDGDTGSRRSKRIKKGKETGWRRCPTTRSGCTQSITLVD